MAKGAKSYTIYIDNSEAERALAQLEKKAAALEAEIKDIEKAGGNASKQMQKLGQTNTEIDRLRKAIAGGLAKSFRDLQNEARKIENQLKRATDPEIIRRLSKEWEVAKRRVLEYEANILKVERAQRQLERETQTFGSKLKAAFLGSFGGNLLANAVSTAVGLIRQGISASIKWALEAENVGQAYERLNQPDLLDELRKATRGTVSDLELMKRAITANNFQIPLENLGKLLEFAQRRARETGQSVDYLVDSIVTGIARKSPLILDNLGINIKRINDEFKKTGDFAQAATNVVTQELEKMGPALDSAADKAERLKVSFQNWGTVAGGVIIQVADRVRQGLIFHFGDARDKADILMEELQDRQKDALKRFRDDELAAEKAWRQGYNQLTEEGKRQELEILKKWLETQKELEQQYLDNGNKAYADQLKIRLQIWGDFINKVEKTVTDSVTLAGLNNQLQTLNDQLQTLEIGSQAFKDTQAEIKKVQKEIDDATGRTAELEAKKAEQRNKEILRARKQLAEQLEDIEIEIMGFRLQGYERELLESQRRYDDLREQLVKYGVDTTRLEELHAQEVVQIYQRHMQQMAEQFRKGNDLVIDARKAMRDKVVSGTAATVLRNADYLAEQIEQKDRDNVAAAEYNLAKAGIGERLKAQRKLLAAQKQQELHNVDLTENERLNIEEKYRQLRFQAEIEYYGQLLNVATSFLGSVLSVFQSISDSKKQQEDNELERDREVNDKKKEQYKKQLDSKLISQQEYDRKIATLDKQQQDKEKAFKLKQFKRDQNAAIIQANIQIAQAILEALSSAPPPFNYILAAGVAAAGAVQLLTIKNQEPPAYGRGGRTKGPRHKSRSKGMPVTNPDTGEIQAYLEGDEGILKRSAMMDYRRYTVTGTPSQIASRLNSAYGGVNWESGATLAPAWTSYTPKAINFKDISSTINRVRQFENGGVFSTNTTAPTPSTPAPPAMAPRMEAMLLANTQAIQELRALLAAGIHAGVYLNELEDQQTRESNIRANSTFRP